MKFMLNETGIGNLLPLKVMDFGVGFDQETEALAGGLGMVSMQGRARMAGRELKVQSGLGQGTTVGTTVIVEVPLEHA